MSSACFQLSIVLFCHVLQQWSITLLSTVALDYYGSKACPLFHMRRLVSNHLTGASTTWNVGEKPHVYKRHAWILFWQVIGWCLQLFGPYLRASDNLAGIVVVVADVGCLPRYMDLRYVELWCRASLSDLHNLCQLRVWLPSLVWDVNKRNRLSR